ncbi:MAG: hypothetical protein QM776_12385 [Rhodocyclaceae bacterium]
MKNYEHSITRVQIIRNGSPDNVIGLDLANARKGTQIVSVYNVPPELPDRSIVSILADGPFAGQPETQVASAAIQWWDTYLTNVEVLWHRNAGT